MKRNRQLVGRYIVKQISLDSDYSRQTLNLGKPSLHSRDYTEALAGSISAAKHLDNTAPKKHRNGDDTVSDLTNAGFEP